jgi:hypothetical protein
VANGRDFTPISDVRLGTWSVADSSITMQCWVNFDDLDQDDPRVLSKAQSGDAEDHVFMLGLSGAGEQFPRMRIKTGADDATGTSTLIASAGALTSGTWHLLAGSYDGSLMRLFTDGAAVDSLSKSGSLRQNGWEVWAGNNPNNTTDFGWAAIDGKLDEVRISSVARTEDWLTTEYNNQSSPSTFYNSLPEVSLPLTPVKRAFLSDGTVVPSGATVPKGTQVKYLLYINNLGGARNDTSIEDVLDPAFLYVSGTARFDASLANCATATCTSVEEATIFATVDAQTPSTDAVDGDRVSFDIPTTTLYVGDQTQANAQLDVPANSVVAVLFEVRVQ